MNTPLISWVLLAWVAVGLAPAAQAQMPKAYASHEKLLQKSLQMKEELIVDLDVAMKKAAPVDDVKDRISQFVAEWKKTDKGRTGRLPIGLSKFEDIEINPAAVSISSVYRDPVYEANVAAVIKKGTSGRIFSDEGEVAKKKDHPDCVAVGRSGAYEASGVIIDNDLVLTAAHICEDDPESVPDLVWLGQVTSNSRVAPQKGQALRVSRYYRHPEYKFAASFDDPRGNDLMLLEIVPEDRGKIEQKTSLAKDEDVVGFGTTPLNSVRAAGYGHSHKDFQGQLKGYGVRRYITLYLASRDVERYGLHQLDLPTGPVIAEFATNSKTELADTCKGDSGGPIYISKNGEFLLVGITSRATPDATMVCGDGSVCVYLPAYREWLEKAYASRETWKAVE